MSTEHYLYQPIDEEQESYDELWKIANPAGSESIAGQAAVDFFTSTQLDPETLRDIWSLSTSEDDMNVDEFYTALRYVTLVQRGIVPVNEGSSLSFCPVRRSFLTNSTVCSIDVLEETMGIYFGFPEFLGVHYSGG